LYLPVSLLAIRLYIPCFNKLQLSWAESWQFC